MKFLYRDEVKVINGFFKGIKGYVTDVMRKNSETSYYVEMKVWTNDNTSYDEIAHWVAENDLEKIEEE